MLLILTVLKLNTFQKKLKYLLVIKPYKHIGEIQAYSSIMCGYFCTESLNFMCKDKSLTDFSNPFSPNDYKKTMI